MTEPTGGLLAWLRAQLDEDARNEHETDYLAGSERGRFRLADIEAKRRILVDLAETDSGQPIVVDEFTEALWYAARVLALPYADQPGYRDEWRPEHWRSW